MPDTSNIKTKYLRPAAVAELLGLSLATLACYRSTSVINGPPYIKVRNRVLYPAEDLKAWITERSLDIPAKDIQE